ncbi:MAG: TetR/AcrR family transcriptional regulator, partial [Nocardioidaceae bacterium]
MASSSGRNRLPVLEVGGVVRERADAARNRLRILAAAERLFASRGVAGVTMDDVAAEAGVGKGTLYRRFGDKGGLAVALLDQRERELQQAMLSGAPPLGPGAPAKVRLAAFIRAYVDLVATQLD